jgi:hypothetical protein
VAWAVARPHDRIWMLPIAGLFLLSAAHDQWWGGFSPAARFLMPAAPLVAMTAIGALQWRPFRLAAAVLLVPTAIIAAYGWQNPRALWPQGDGNNRVLSAILPLATQSWLPSLRAPGTEP